MSMRLADRSFQYPVEIAEICLVWKLVNLHFPPISLFSKWKKIAKFHSSWDDHFFTLLMQLFELNRNNSILDNNVIDEILEKDFDTLLENGSKILNSIEGTLLEEEIFVEFDEFMAMTAVENSDSESDTEEPPFEKITINTNYKIKTSLEEPPTNLELKPLHDNLEYIFLEEPFFLPVIISSQLSKERKNKLVSVLKKHKEAFAWKTTDIPSICPSFCKHKIQLLDDKKPVVQKQRKLNPNMQEVVKKEIIKLLARCMLAIFHDMNEESVEVFMDHFSVFGNSFEKCLNNLDKMLQRCKDVHLVLNWENFHFMVKEGIVLGQKVSSAGLVVDKEKINVSSKIPPPTNIKDTPFEFDDECQEAFKLLKEKLTCAPVIVSPNWNLLFELMCDASDFSVGAVLGDKPKSGMTRKVKDMRKEFKQGNKVLRFHSKYKFKQPKLRSRWLGPYIVKHQYPSGYVELYGKDGKTFIVNGHRLKLYHEEDNDPREAVTPFFPN
ncbi:reverse transcriptase domain-containing protein [Tanacetum coccineum]